MSLRCIVFDMDDTLYLERDYVRSGFQAVSEAIKSRLGTEGAWFECLWSGFCSGVRGNNFDLLLQQYPNVREHFSLDELVILYRTHRPAISLPQEVSATLRCLKDKGLNLALISDGPVEVQRAKVVELGIERYFDRVVLTGMWGNEFWKPHPRGFLDVMEAFGVTPGQCVYIGDNPTKDFIGAKELGWTTVRLRTPRQLRYQLEPHSDAHSPHVEVRSWKDLAHWLNAAVNPRLSVG